MNVRSAQVDITWEVYDDAAGIVVHVTHSTSYGFPWHCDCQAFHQDMEQLMKEGSYCNPGCPHTRYLFSKCLKHLPTWDHIMTQLRDEAKIN